MSDAAIGATGARSGAASFHAASAFTFIAMESSKSSGLAVKLMAYWMVVGVPLAWGVWKTLIKLPALFQ